MAFACMWTTLFLLLTAVVANVQSATAPCTKNIGQVQKEGRRCLPFCSPKKPCRNRKSSCQCDGSCGLVCVPNDVVCKEMDSPPHGSVHFPEGFSFQAIAIYECDDEFELIGNDERACRGDGRWTGEDPICVHEDVHCQKPTFEVPNAFADLWPDRTEFYIHDEVQYKCIDGFSPSRGDQSTTQCIAHETKVTAWTPIKLTCKANECGYPDNVENGYFEGSSFSFGAHISYHCNAGYSLVGSGTRSCLADQQWSGSNPLCKVLSCPKPADVTHGFVKYKSLSHLSVASYYCNSGFIIRGPQQRECLSHGNWSGESPRCVEVACGDPLIPLHGRIVRINGTRVNDQVIYECDPHTHTSGSTKAKCIVEQDEAKWSHLPPTCLRSCEVIALENGVVQLRQKEVDTGTMVDHGMSVLLICNDRFQMSSSQSSNSDSSRCEDGSWSLQVSCLPARCQQHLVSASWLHERNLELPKTLPNLMEHGEELVLQCNFLNPEMENEGTINCQFGQWIYPDNMRCIPRSCSLSNLLLAHGSISVNEVKLDPLKESRVAHSTVLHFECTDPGYELYEEGHPVDYPYGSLRTCSNGTLLGYAVTCKPGRCSCSSLLDSLARSKMTVDQQCPPDEVIEAEEGIRLKCVTIGRYSQPVDPLVAVCRERRWILPPSSSSCDEGQVTPTISKEKAKASSLQTVDGDEYFVLKPPVRKSDCKFQLTDGPVLAFHDDVRITKNSIFRSGTSLVFRCSNITHFSFVGNSKRLCRQGSWLGNEPSCISLDERNISSAPVIIYNLVLGNGLVAPNGTLMVESNSTVRLSCLWNKSNGNVVWKWRNQVMKGDDVAKEWVGDESLDLFIYNITDSRSGLFTCINPSGNAHGIRIKVSDELILVNPTIIGDQLTAVVSPNQEDATFENEDKSEDLAAESGPVLNHCKWNTNDTMVMAFGGDKTKEGNLFAIGTKLSIRCKDVFQFKLEGNRNVRCSKGGEWIPQWPRCVRLSSNNRDSAPPLSVSVSVNKSSIFVTENGEVVVPKYNLIYLMCKFAQSKPVMTLKGIRTQIVTDFYNTEGETIWYLHLGPFDRMTSFTFSCSIPRQDVSLTHSLIIRVGDTCQLDQRKWSSSLASTKMERDIYLEGDVVQLQCKNKRALLPSYLTCSKGGVWINGPILKCNQV